MVELFCDTCGDGFDRQPSKVNDGKNFCSKTCQSEWMSGDTSPHKKDLTYTCEICGTEFEAENSKNANRFCSRDCFYEWERRDDLDEICNICGESFRRQNHHKGEYCSKKCQGIAQRAEGNPNWSGGYNHYYGENWYEQRREVWRRDQYRCQDCGKSENKLDRKPDVHHIEPFRDFNDYEEANNTENLISLCHECHMQEEYNE